MNVIQNNFAKVVVHRGSIYDKMIGLSEEELEGFAIQNKTSLFGRNLIYLDLKKKISSIAGISKIPDGILLTGSDTANTKLWLVEYELESHDLERHVLPQITGFVTAIKNERTKKQLRDVIYQRIKNDSDAFKRLKWILTEEEDPLYFIESVLERNLGIIIVIDKAPLKLMEIARRIYLAEGIKADILEFEIYHNKKTDHKIFFLTPLVDIFVPDGMPSANKKIVTIPGLTDAIKKIISEQRHKPFSLKEVMDEIQNGEIIKVPAKMKKLTYGQPAFSHSVRSIINGLRKRGKIKSVGWGEYLQIGEFDDSVTPSGKIKERKFYGKDKPLRDLTSAIEISISEYKYKEFTVRQIHDTIKNGRFPEIKRQLDKRPELIQPYPRWPSVTPLYHRIEQRIKRFKDQGVLEHISAGKYRQIQNFG